MKMILLTCGKVALVDNEDFERLSKFKWYYNGEPRYVRRSAGRTMAHEILQTDKWIDHKDGNELNHQKLNLRECTSAQNHQNTRKRRSCSSKYKGVSFNCGLRVKKNWQARITYQNIFGWSTCINLGFFFTEEEAARAYDMGARHYHEEFAALNFPGKGEQSCLRGQSQDTLEVFRDLVEDLKALSIS